MTRLSRADIALALMYHRWCRASQHLPVHPEATACVCMRCHFRRQNALFWASIPPTNTMSAVNFVRATSADDGNDSDTINPHYDEYGNDHSVGIFAHDHLVIPETPLLQESQPQIPVRGRARARPAGSSLQQQLQQAGLQHLVASSASQAAGPASALAPPPPTLQQVHPHVSTRLDDDFNRVVDINWMACSALEMYEVLTSQHLQCGAFNSMSYVLRHAVGQLLGTLKPFIPETDIAALTKLAVKASPQLQAAFEKCCKAVGVLSSLRRHMTTYTAAKANAVRVKPGSFPEVNAVAQDTCRLASFMVDPRCIEIFGRMANPRQDRLSVDFPELRIVEVKQRLMEEFTKDFFNNPDVSPQSNPSIVAWCNVEYDAHPAPPVPRDWMWVRANDHVPRVSCFNMFTGIAQNCGDQNSHGGVAYKLRQEWRPRQQLGSPRS